MSWVLCTDFGQIEEDKEVYILQGRERKQCNFFFFFKSFLFLGLQTSCTPASSEKVELKC